MTWLYEDHGKHHFLRLKEGEERELSMDALPEATWEQRAVKLRMMALEKRIADLERCVSAVVYRGDPLPHRVLGHGLPKIRNQSPD